MRAIETLTVVFQTRFKPSAAWRVGRATLLAAVLAGVLFAAATAGARDFAENWATNLPPLKAEVKFIGGPGLMPVHRGFVTCGTNKFTFLLPEGYRLETADPQKITLASADLKCLITWRLLNPMPSESTELDPAHYRELLLSRHPGGKILETFSLSAVGRHGPAFDLRWSGAGGLARRERTLFVLSTAGVLEFSLVTSLDRFDAGRQDFDAVLVSFRASDGNGKLVVPVISNQL
jgi:hypothetical protein